MNIGQFSDSFLPIVDGVSRVVYNYAQIIGYKGHNCYVISPMADDEDAETQQFNMVGFKGKPIRLMPGYKVGLPRLDYNYSKRINEIDLDIVHAHSPFISGHEALYIAKKKSVPLVGSFHSKYYDDFYKITKSKQLSKVGIKYILNFYEKCDEVWAVSQDAAQTLREYGFSKEIEIMQNGTNIRSLDKQAVSDVIKKYGLRKHPILLYVGQMNWKKNILRTLEAAALLKKSGIDFQLVFVGQGTDNDEIKEKAYELGIRDFCIFTGHIDDVRLLDALYYIAKILVFPSLYDTAGLVVQEAAAMHTPAVVIANTGAAENIKNLENGLACSDTTESLYKSLSIFLENKNLQEHLSQKAYETLPIEWDKIIDSVLLRYKSIIKKYKDKV